MAGAVEYTDYISRTGRTLQMRVRDMTLNHLIMILQSWRFGECRVPLHCHCSQVHSDPKLEHLIRIIFMGQIEQTVCKQITNVKS